LADTAAVDLDLAYSLQWGEIK